MFKDIQQRLPQFREHFAEFPEAMFNAFQQQKQINKNLLAINQSLEKQAKNNEKRTRWLIVGAALIITLWKFKLLDF